MSNYKKLFFDFDDTLIDFKAAEHVALPKVFDEYNFPLTEEVEAKYMEINAGLWSDLEKGEITRDQLMSQRFAKTMAFFNRKVDGLEMDQRYRELLTETIVLIDGAKEVIETLHENQYELYMVTNGMANTQLIRIEASGLKPYFSHVFVSEETGYQKPQIEYFDYVFKAIGGVTKSQCLIIGDSFSADVMGGIHAGIDTCWFNPSNKPNNTGFTPTYEVQKLQDILKIIKK